MLLRSGHAATHGYQSLLSKILKSFSLIKRSCRRKIWTCIIHMVEMWIVRRAKTTIDVYLSKKAIGMTSLLVWKKIVWCIVLNEDLQQMIWWWRKLGLWKTCYSGLDFVKWIELILLELFLLKIIQSIYQPA